jgi:hypothetical protein
VLLDEPGADDERLDELTRRLRNELRELENLDDERTRTSGSPDGARGMDAATLGSLLVTLAQPQALQALVSTLRAWLGRTPDPARRVRVELDGDVLELSAATADQQDQLVSAFLARHGTPA